jgi:predicted lipoprotein with Yx(FWY)xxD motif
LPTKFSLVILTLSIILFATAATEANTIDTSYHRDIEIYLVDEDGRTLYYNEDDKPGESKVNHENWPPFYSEVIEVPSDLNRADFRTIKRADGKFQTAYKDWPLYLYSTCLADQARS